MRAGGAMAEFLIAAAGFVLAMVALGLVRILRGPADADRMMAAQLLGTGGIAALLLLAAGTDDAGRRGCRPDAGVARRLRRRRVRQQRASSGCGRARRDGRLMTMRSLLDIVTVHRGFGRRRVLPGRNGRAAALSGLARRACTR